MEIYLIEERLNDLNSDKYVWKPVSRTTNEAVAWDLKNALDNTKTYRIVRLLS